MRSMQATPTRNEVQAGGPLDLWRLPSHVHTCLRPAHRCPTPDRHHSPILQPRMKTSTHEEGCHRLKLLLSALRLVIRPGKKSRIGCRRHLRGMQAANIELQRLCEGGFPFVHHFFGGRGYSQPKG